MPNVFANYPFDAEIFLHEWKNAPDPVKTAMLQSGALEHDEVIQKMIGGDSNVFTIPFYNVLSGNVVNYDGETDITANQTSGDYQTGVVFGRATAFTAKTFTKELTGADAMGNVARKIGLFWNKKNQATLLKILDGVFSCGGNDANTRAFKAKHILDLTSNDNPKVDEATANDVMTDSLGDNKGIYSLAVMHSKVAGNLEKMKLLEFYTQTDKEGITRKLNMASWNGLTVVIDDNGTVDESGATPKYTTYLLGQGVIRCADGALEVPVESDRNPYTNGGQDTLITRERMVMHPNGFSFAPAGMAKASPTDDELATGASWALKHDHKAIPLAKIISNG